jgi:hypothetical protein
LDFPIASRAPRATRSRVSCFRNAPAQGFVQSDSVAIQKKTPSFLYS